MYTFENDLSLYDEFDVATEGLADTIKDKASKGFKGFMNLMHNLKETLKSFGKWLMDKINRIVDIGKRLKRDRIVNPEIDEKANNMAKEIISDITNLASSVDAALHDIADANVQGNRMYHKDLSDEKFTELKKASNETKAKCYSKINEALQKSGEIANKLKQLPRINMSYSTCGSIYKGLKAISDENSKMYKMASYVDASMNQSYALDAKQESLHKFLNLYQKLRKCTEALLARLKGMSGSDSNLIKQEKGENTNDDSNGNNKDMDPHLTNSFYSAVNSGNVRLVRSMMEHSLIIDPTSYQFHAMEKAASSMKGLYDKHDGGKEFITDKNRWDKDYMVTLMGKLANNFSKERLDHFKQVVRHVYIDSKPVDKDKEKYESEVAGKIRRLLSEPKFTKLNKGNPIDVDRWIACVKNKVEKDAKDNPNDKKKQLIAQRIKDQHQRLLYILSVTNVANVKKWLNL